MTRSALPGSVKVGYRAYRVEPWAPDEAADAGNMGLIEYLPGVIRIVEGMPAVEEANTLLHEVLHACWRSAGLGNKVDEETVVSAFANALCQVMQDNPALFPWLQKAVKC